MYYIRKQAENWAVHNNLSGRSRQLSELEIQKILDEFPNLKSSTERSQSLTYFRNRIKSIDDLP
ncbi:MAG: hypothetical protein AAF399_12265 [Bacteroidota bacterium]